MTTQLNAVISSVKAIARDILEIELKSKDNQPLPKAAPGSHIELQLPNGMNRQYSLVNALSQTQMESYVVAVGLDANSRGGSKWIHQKLRVGQSLNISEPRNFFALNPDDKHILLIAGGIGITPVYAMTQYCQAQGIRCELWVSARSASRLAYYDALKALDGIKVHFHFDDEQQGPMDLASRLKDKNWESVYSCGPAPMLDAITAATEHWPSESVHMERFSGADVEAASDNSFELYLKASGISTTVNEGETILDAIERVDGFVPWSCREGICGSCETKVLEGEIDHRDMVLSDEEREAGDRMLVCVSGCKSSKLVLDI